MDKQKQRIYWIDILKGLAIVLMVIGHEIDYLCTQGIISSNWKILHEIIYSFHMPLMFIMSGYLFALTKKSTFKEFVLDSFLTLYIPYLILTYGYWLERFVAQVVLGIKLDKNLAQSGKELISMLWLGEGIEWFLLSLFIVRLAYEMLNRLMKKEKERRGGCYY